MREKYSTIAQKKNIVKKLANKEKERRSKEAKLAGEKMKEVDMHKLKKPCTKKRDGQSHKN